MFTALKKLDSFQGNWGWWRFNTIEHNYDGFLLQELASFIFKGISASRILLNGEIEISTNFSCQKDHLKD